ncbi:hypothetical protein DTO013E5_5940 [Penicillium roqueforti]|uniref:uncharacterized protein n=1 Tax=Penicillium roqueforti TaxID=5082 RepID=UPI00190B6168|nr:uncharacterized protein LCP9604111_7344 [Penicillium roqueforti]KAF9244391.1 hypothetical protein LCP9604111_7344 [Penicillium roqueforti]KAI1835972.1 hypothetical protein CBS147337_3121 [Penicillium roqueforti]KAI2678360.1 hypothetical protein LCP963914a_7791 [Penicillium roqueforti]KAI2682994.1 hypothetical protein CBS147355_2134 [Penicillium roqueforti]KAI2701562.1 hypothetical protein CBS147372_4615 [Penicillium roqueforti]
MSVNLLSRRKRCKKRFGHSKNCKSTGEDEVQLEKLDKTQEVLQKEYWYQECELHKWQSSIPGGPMKLAYESLRKNPKWYMQNELIKDCAGRGGCCGRECGCCEKRESTPEKSMGAGHCTTGCACCSSFRGCELTAQEKKNIRDALRAALKYSNSAYLLSMSRAYIIRDRKLSDTFVFPRVPDNCREESATVTAVTGIFFPFDRVVWLLLATTEPF